MGARLWGDCSSLSHSMHRRVAIHLVSIGMDCCTDLICVQVWVYYTCVYLRVIGCVSCGAIHLGS